MVAVEGASGPLAATSCETGLTITGTIETMTMITTISRARIETAVKPNITGTALTRQVLPTQTVARALIGTHLYTAVLTLKPWVAMTSTIVAEADVGAVVGTSLHGAVSTTVAVRAVAGAVETGTMIGTVIGTQVGRAVELAEPGVAVTREVAANSVLGTVVGARFDRTVITHPP